MICSITRRCRQTGGGVPPTEPEGKDPDEEESK